MKKDIITRAKNVLLPYTPLSADCGLICDKACCKGDSETGMLLFPGEDTPFAVKENNGTRLCVCNGKCDRLSRPLSCIIFPFFPYMTEDGKIKAKEDIRGISVCPLISHKDEVIFSRIFPEAALCGLVQGLFNLLPLYPMDGGRVISGLIPEKGRIWVENTTIALLLSLGIYTAWWLKLGISALFPVLILAIGSLGRKIPCKATKKAVQ